ncbi:MAG TPA: multiubiquitin domain-containing protein [Xanthobacteraceae bacterium]|nr:multiubiquitin domain-containing protein [Xanthobacteraceae bacterium]
MSDDKKEYEFFVDGKRYESAKPHLTGAEIKTDANVPANYQLFLEEEGDKPDKPISDSETVDLQGQIKHFFAVPPATFGTRDEPHR